MKLFLFDEQVGMPLDSSVTVFTHFLPGSLVQPSLGQLGLIKWLSQKGGFLLRLSKNPSVQLMPDFWGSHMTPYNCEIVDCGAFCEVIFFCISPKNLFGAFSDSLAIHLAFFKTRKATV